MIDYTKPIEYIDGSPARYLGRNPINNEHVVTPRGRPQNETGNFYTDNGYHISNAYMSSTTSSTRAFSMLSPELHTRISSAIDALEAQGTYGFDATDQRCCYLNSEGNKCLVGLMFTAEQLDTWGDWRGTVIGLAPQVFTATEALQLRRFQRIHDNFASDELPLAECIDALRQELTRHD